MENGEWIISFQFIVLFEYLPKSVIPSEVEGSSH